MTLTVRFLGLAVVTVSLVRAPSPPEPRETAIPVEERHAGDFPIGFVGSPTWRPIPSDVEA